MSVPLWTKWLWVQAQLQSLELLEVGVSAINFYFKVGQKRNEIEAKHREILDGSFDTTEWFLLW